MSSDVAFLFTSHTPQELDVVQADQLQGGFFDGWPDAPTPERHLQLLRGSYRTILAWDGRAPERGAVGFITAISDGVLSAYIPLLEVLPDYRGRGIGTRLVTMMLDSLDMYMVDLACDDDLVPFYERLGLQRSSAMIRRRYDRQSGGPT